MAQALVGQAEQQESELLPVVLPLASWAVHRPPLEDGLVEQTAQVYGIDERVARPWIEADQLLPLLDGLDEMEAAAQTACIEAINTYHQAHPRPLAVGAIASSTACCSVILLICKPDRRRHRLPIHHIVAHSLEGVPMPK